MAGCHTIVDPLVESLRERERLAEEKASKRQAESETRGIERKKMKREEERAAADDSEKYDEEVAKKDHKRETLAVHRREKADRLMRSTKVRIYPDAGQTKLLLLWLDAVRYAKNKVVEHINSGGDNDLQELRRSRGLVSGDDFRNHVPERIKIDIPRDLVDQAVRDCSKDCNSRLAQLEARVKKRVWRRHFVAMRKRGEQELPKAERKLVPGEVKTELEKAKEGWQFGYSRKKAATASMMLSRRFLNMKKSAGYSELFGGPDNRKVMSAERDDALPANFESDCRLVHDRRAKTFVLCVPATRPDTQGPCRREHGRVVSIDPGLK